MSNEQSGNSKKDRPFDLEERTAVFGETVIRFAKRIPPGDITSPLISQLVLASTSIGANWCEADDAGSKKEFRFRISLCKRESRESKHWLRMVVAAVPEG
jgi:four helix bundle protein